MNIPIPFLYCCSCFAYSFFRYFSGCCFVTFYTRRAALKAQDALHNVKTLNGVSSKNSKYFMTFITLIR